MNKFSKKFLMTIAIISAVILAATAFSTLSAGRAGVASNVANIISQPFRSLFSAVYSKTTDVIDSFVNASRYAEENEMLRATLAQMENEKSDIEAYKAENERLLALLDMQAESSELNLQGARVIGRESDNWYNTISIDKGSASGVQVNDVVLSAQGLVGTVSEVGLTWAKVREITDVESSIGAVCARTGDRGVLEGDYELALEGRCRLNYVSKDANIVVGDRIETSGSGSIYPKGVYVGYVVEISDDDNGLTLSAIIESEVEFNALSEVLVGR
ncbi:MAG: rod shape-determining protein MreC [Clostridia bacterium]|nr:rod shape-determining protein MreC [Clostridia bacterium]